MASTDLAEARSMRRREAACKSSRMVVMAKLDKRMDIQHKSLKCSARNLRPEFQSSLESPIAMQVYHKMIRSDRR